MGEEGKRRKGSEKKERRKRERKKGRKRQGRSERRTGSREGRQVRSEGKAKDLIREKQMANLESGSWRGRRDCLQPLI